MYDRIFNIDILFVEYHFCIDVADDERFIQTHSHFMDVSLSFSNF